MLLHHFQTNTFRKGLNPLIAPAISEIVPLLSFYNDGFDIKLLTKVDMPLNKETKSSFVTNSPTVFCFGDNMTSLILYLVSRVDISYLICDNISLDLCVCVYIYVYIYIYMCVCVCVCIYIYIYIYIVIHRLFHSISVAIQARFSKLGSKPGWLKYQSKILPLSHEETNASERNLNAYVSHLFFFCFFLHISA